MESAGQNGPNVWNPQANDSRYRDRDSGLPTYVGSPAASFAACLRQHRLLDSRACCALRRPALFAEIRNPGGDVLIVGDDILR